MFLVLFFVNLKGAHCRILFYKKYAYSYVMLCGLLFEFDFDDVHTISPWCTTKGDSLMQCLNTELPSFVRDCF